MKRWVINKSELPPEISPNISWSSSDSDEAPFMSQKRIKIEINESPVISSKLIQQESPSVLITDANSNSPVICSNRKINKVKKKIYNAELKLFPNEIKAKSEVAIEDVLSQNSNRDKENSRVNIEDVLSQNSTRNQDNTQLNIVVEDESYKISQFLNTQNSDFGQSSNYFNTQTISSITESVKPERIKTKRRFKKFGLAGQLQSALDNQSNSLAIWKHELYLNTESYDVGVGLELSVLRKINEFGRVIYECDKKCLVIPINNVEINSTSIIIYKPYGCEDISYNEENYCCYFNVFKVIEK